MWSNYYSRWDKTIWNKKMIQTIITNAQLKKHPNLHGATIIEKPKINEVKKVIKFFSKDTIYVYDTTHNTQHKNNEIIAVSDHINQTGHNPLIGNQNKLNTPFIDISNLYQTTNGITTHCLGRRFNQHKKNYKYPSTHLCYISIIAHAIGIKKIHAFLVNQK